MTQKFHLIEAIGYISVGRWTWRQSFKQKQEYQILGLLLNTEIKVDIGWMFFSWSGPPGVCTANVH